MQTALRFVPDSRSVLRAAMVVTGAVSLVFLNASARQRGYLATAGHPFLDFVVQVAPWGLLGVALLLGTAERIEDAVFRRRMVLAMMGAVGFALVGVMFWRFVPAGSRLIGVARSALVFWVIWFPTYWFVSFRGFGRGVDASLARWLGPAPYPDHETATRKREREIREAASAEERHRLAQDLHDSIKQEIFAIHTSAATIQERLTADPNGAREAIDQVRRSSRDAMTEIEAMLDRLSPTPVENTSLVSALKKQCEALALRTGADVTCDIRDLPSSKLLPPGAHEALFRIAQEALSNVGKHARATAVHVSLKPAERDLLLVVEDNGQGFDKAKPSPEARLGMGLKNMQERSRAVGGRFEFSAAPGRGVTISVGIPILLPSVFFDGVPRWVIVAGGAAVIVPMAIAAGLMMFSSASEMNWTNGAGLAVYAVFVFFMIRRGIREGNVLK
jgi:signal transduction histidine kinase